MRMRRQFGPHNIDMQALSTSYRLSRAACEVRSVDWELTPSEYELAWGIDWIGRRGRAKCLQRYDCELPYRLSNVYVGPRPVRYLKL